MPQIQLIDQINDLSLYAARAVADENGKNLDSTYAKKSEVPAAQVNADWNASSGVAQILNKPSVYDQSTINSMMAGKQGTLQETQDITLGMDGIYPMVNLRQTISSGNNVSGLKHNYQAPAYAENVAHVGAGPNSATYVDLTFDGNILNWYSPIGFSVQDGVYGTSVYIVALAGVSSWSDVTSATPFAVSVNSYDFGEGTVPTFQYGFDNAQDFTHYNGYGWSADSELMRHQLVLFTTSAPTSVSEISTYAETTWQPQSWEGDPWGIQVYSAEPVYSKGLSIDRDSALDILDLSTVASSGSYNDLSDKPNIPTVPTAGNMLSTTNNVLNVTTTAGITDIQLVQSMPAQPVATVLYLIPEN